MVYTNAQKRMNALEEAVKALTGESQLDLSVVNTMIIKHRARRDAAEQAIEETRERLEQEQITNKETQAQIDEINTLDNLHLRWYSRSGMEDP